MIGRCDFCGNEQSKTFEVRIARKIYIFDTFECATQMLAPSCAHCGGKVAGRGIHAGGVFYCDARCAKNAANKVVGDGIVPSAAAVPLT